MKVRFSFHYLSCYLHIGGENGGVGRRMALSPSTPSIMGWRRLEPPREVIALGVSLYIRSPALCFYLVYYELY